MRIPSSSATARVAPDFHAARGDKNGSRTPDDNDNHGQSPGTSSAGNGTSTPDSSSQEAALRQHSTPLSEPRLSKWQVMQWLVSMRPLARRIPDAGCCGVGK